MAWSVIIFARSQATAVETVGKDGSASRKKKTKKKNTKMKPELSLGNVWRNTERL